MEAIFRGSDVVRSFWEFIIPRVPESCIDTLYRTLSSGLGSEDVIWPESNALQLPATILLDSTVPLNFILELGLWIALCGRNLHSVERPGQPLYAQVLHSIVKGYVECDEGIKILVAASTAKEALHCEFPDYYRKEVSVIRKFFEEFIQIDTVEWASCKELRKYATYRCRGVAHDSSLHLSFPTQVNTWLFFHDVRALVEEVLNIKHPLLPVDFHNLGNILYWIEGILEYLANSLACQPSQNHEALSYYCKAFRLRRQVHMTYYYVGIQHPACFQSLHLLKISLDMEIKDTENFTMLNNVDNPTTGHRHVREPSDLVYMMTQLRDSVSALRM